MSMKNLNFKIITGAIFLIVASMSCSKLCDDEDDKRNLKSKETIISDSLKVPSEHHNET
jgi:hypothetical protein